MEHFNPVAVINQGASGGHDPELHTFDMVLGETSVPPPATKSVADPYTKGQVVTGVISSADSWNNQIDRMLYLNELNGSSCEEMESNSVAQVCKTYDVPYLGIRILSNTGIYGEDFNPETGSACQEYVLNVAKNYIQTVLNK